MRSLVLLLILFITLSVTAQGKIYKIVNKDGTVSFSDLPTPGAEEVALNSSSTTMQFVPVQAQPVPIQTRPSPSFQLSILSPAADATIRDNNGNLKITAKIQPKAPGKYILDFAGQQHSSDSGVFTLKGINRGAHTYSLAFVNNTGKVIASSDERTLYLHQASVLIRNSNN